MSILDDDQQVVKTTNNRIKPIAEVSRIFHAVGQGGFCTEFFVPKIPDANEHLYVYDCGGNNQKFMESYIKSFFGKIPKQTIDAVFISHLHEDHINGLPYLFQHANVQKIYLPQLTPNRVVETILYNAIHFPKLSTISSIFPLLENSNDNSPRIIQVKEGEIRPDNNNENEIVSGSLISIGYNKKNGYRSFEWKYIPYNPQTPAPDFSKKDEIVQKLEKIYKTKTSIEDYYKSIAEMVAKLKPEEIRSLYKSIYGNRIHNSQSMALFSGILAENADNLLKIKLQNPALKLFCPLFFDFCTSKNLIMHQIPCNFLYTGDFEVKKCQDNKLKDFYQKANVWETICGIQIPHHGSRQNYSQILYEPMYYAIAFAGVHNKYHHPNIDTLIKISQMKCYPYVVTEDINTTIYQNFTF